MLLHYNNSMKNKLLISTFLFLSLFTANVAFTEELEDSISQAANLYNEAIDLYSQDENKMD